MTLEPKTESRERWRMLALLSVAELLGMSVWFAANAVSPQLSSLWALEPAQVGWLTGAVQLGFVVGTALAALLNLADVLPIRAYFATCVLLAGLMNSGLLLAPSFSVALALRFVTGMLLAGVYPPGMKMIATWFDSARGLAIGTLVGALTVGKAMPYIVRALEGESYRTVILSVSAGAALSAFLVRLLYRDGPFPFERRPFSWRLAGVAVTHRPTRLAILGYLGHMWELYAMWTWIPAFVAAGLATRGQSEPWLGDLLSFGAIAAGGLGCVWGGWQADRSGRERVVILSLVLSGGCSLVIGLFHGSSPWLLGPVAWLWGFFVVADSAQFSTLVTERAPRHAVGTALTLQTSVGFLLTVVTIQLVPGFVDLVGWRWAFAVLALGPAAGIAAMRRLARLGVGATPAGESH